MQKFINALKGQAIACFVSLVFILLIGTKAEAQQKHFGKQAYMLFKVYEKYHFQPASLNDDFSKDLYDNIIDDLDGNGLYFTRENLNVLEKWRTKLDDEIINQSTDFVDELAALYRKKLNWADTTVAELLLKPVNFSAADTITFLKHKQPAIYSKNDVELKKKWSGWLKYLVLKAIYTSESENEDPFKQDIKKLLEKEPEARKNVREKYRKHIKKLLETEEGFENYIAAVYLNNIAAVYDPHSTFFTPADKQSFETSVSANVLSFGFYFDENENGEITVTHLIPGGAAWESNQLHKGDVLLKVKSSAGKAYEISASTINDIIELSESPSFNEAEFTIRKTDGNVKKVLLKKSKVRSDENVVKSYVLKGENKIGYISLPSFYTEWENENPLGCANDVAKEIVKLQEENIEGLILDLRYNGGGSVREAISLAGLFIDEGPICIYKTRNEKPYILKDMNRGTAYSGPLVILVNSSSASASELFAAAVQDYNRGVIVGSSTYGKATGQIIIPLDTGLTLKELMEGGTNSAGNELGFTKITTEKFYRVTNKTHQLKGVVPDIILPEPYYFYDYKESAYKKALPYDSIVKNALYRPLPAINKNKLRENSTARVKNSKAFLKLTSANDSLRLVEKNERKIKLAPQHFSESEKITTSLINSIIDAVTDSSTAFKVVNNVYDEKLLNIDEFEKDINNDLIDDMQNDIYIQEAFYIISDLITFGKN